MSDHKNHKYISKYIGPSGKTVYVYDDNNSKSKPSTKDYLHAVKSGFSIAAKNVPKIRRHQHNQSDWLEDDARELNEIYNNLRSKEYQKRRKKQLAQKGKKILELLNIV